MKKILFLSALLFGIFGFAQFTVTGSTATDVLVGKAPFVKLTKSNVAATIEYMDFSYLKDNKKDNETYYFHFSIDDTTLDKIYKIITDHFESRTRDLVTLNFPEGNLYLNFTKDLGMYDVSFQFDNRTPDAQHNGTPKRETFPLDRKSVDKLFGK